MVQMDHATAGAVNLLVNYCEHFQIKVIGMN